jgi:hypothetical protein
LINTYLGLPEEARGQRLRGQLWGRFSRLSEMWARIRRTVNGERKTDE